MLYSSLKRFGTLNNTELSLDTLCLCCTVVRIQGPLTKYSCAGVRRGSEDLNHTELSLSTLLLLYSSRRGSEESNHTKLSQGTLSFTLREFSVVRPPNSRHVLFAYTMQEFKEVRKSRTTPNSHNTLFPYPVQEVQKSRTPPNTHYVLFAQ